jgi:hypothetical protein
LSPVAISPRGRVSPWPRPDELLLLRAALLDGGVALNAWRQFRERHAHIDHLGSDAYRILPQLFCNLRALHFEDLEHGRLKGIYRREWYANQQILQEAREVIVHLRAAGVEGILVRGCALALHLRSIGARPLDGIEILVRRHQMERTVELLTAAGWQLPDKGRSKQLMRFRSSRFLVSPDGRRLDLHWSAGFPRGGDTRLWDEAVTVSVRGVAMRTPNLADQLLLACEHGLGWTPAPLGWITDAMLLMRMTAGHPDWHGLVRRAQECELTLDLADALEFLAAEFSVRPPPEIMVALRLPRAPTAARLLHEIKMSSRDRSPLWSSVRHTARQLDMARRLAPASPRRSGPGRET